MHFSPNSIPQNYYKKEKNLPQARSLHDSIFGPSHQPKKSHQRQKSPVSSLRAKHLLSKFLSPSSRERLRDERNVSTESLPTSMPTSSASSASAAGSTMDGNLLYGRRWLLRLYDRRKSASTGELNKSPSNGKSAHGSFTELRDGQETNNSGSLLSVPQVMICDIWSCYANVFARIH